MRNNLDQLKSAIESAWDRRGELSPESVDDELRGQVDACLQGLESGGLRVAEPDADGSWRVNGWLKQAILLHFRITPNRVMPGGVSDYYDKVDLRFSGDDDSP